MPLKYSKALVIGATSGIGLAYAEKVVADGKKVIVVGRRKEILDEFVKKHGENKAEAVEFDITQLDDIPKFAQDIVNKHPDLDCIFINSGIQRGFDFTKPETIDLSAIGLEFTTNYLSYVHLTHAFLPFLQKQKNETALIYTSSGLALIPLVKRLNYSASKAALHHFLIALRAQLKDGPGNVKVIEVFPPAVQTELHDERHQPDIKNGRQMGMPLKDFTEDSWAKILNDDDDVPVGVAVKWYSSIESRRQELFRAMNGLG
ncbi:short-chain dehydrogenase/ reductase-like protein [Amniculicola lignicola CBS 123094]|uniref:Short-chain dehydrogenase/ reductase-like protein n=1 Tax=Amniculicola lignicola CBS 123094 TaxID=1392246 RepID=A0A6A5X0Z7_9PLEO|nr:short-chain dehydrogenase/ reductase-like protein [Amniculicola lignicola CBS 123094]